MTKNQIKVLVTVGVILLLITATFWIAAGWVAGVITGIICLIVLAACFYVLFSINIAPDPTDRMIKG